MIRFPNSFHRLFPPLGFFCLTFLLCYLSSHLRLPVILSVFWVVNAIIAGLFVRFPRFHRFINYVASFLAMILNDYLFSDWLFDAVLINAANILYIAVVAIGLSTLWKNEIRQLAPTRILLLFPVCLLAAIVCGIWGGFVSNLHQGHAAQLLEMGSWISEQLSTGLMILPVIFTFRWEPNFHWRKTSGLALLSLPLLFWISSTISGPGSIAFPLPILIWCALVLPIFISTLVTFLVGVLEIILVYRDLMNTQMADETSHLMSLISIRLGVAALVLTPYMVAVTVSAIQQLNRRLEHRANTDFLTLLLSRAGLFEKLESRKLSEQKQVGLILFDVDHFKSINDNYGHSSGDRVLQQLGQIVQRLCDRGLLAARFGGEEFAIITFDMDELAIYHLAERVRSIVASHRFVLSDETISVTISSGWAIERELETSDWQTLIARLVSNADGYLYQSKAQGRNLTTPDWY